MEPSIGRIVHFTANNGEIYPAIIIHVWSSTCVNLEVFGQAPDKYPTSVVQGDSMYQWNWPPRV